VTAAAPPAVTERQGATNLRSTEINLLPIGRTPFLIAELAAGLTNNTPNASQLTLSGAFAYDNVFLIDGVDVNDNLLGTPNDLYVEDAIDEVQVQTSAISAEYGRFSGGVINIITKSGGNLYSGSYRTTLTNPSWSEETPRETVARPSKLSTFHEFTSGGAVVKDRLWYFGAGRLEDSSTAGSLPLTNLPYTKTADNKRYEAKLTGAIRSGQTLQGTFIDNRVHRANEPVLSFSIDPHAFVSPSTPNRLFVMTYTGALSPRLLATAQYSQKHYETAGVGGTSTDLLDSPFLTRSGTQYQYNAPYFDATDPEQRNNRQITGSVSSVVASPRAGSHQLKSGFESFTSTRIGANAQSATGYVFQSNFKTDASGLPVLDDHGYLIPLFVPGTSRVQRWIPHRGAEFNLTTSSAYVQDRWIASRRLTLDLGLRVEHAGSEATGGLNSVHATTVVPRLGASYDLTGNGRTVLQGSYAHYAGGYNDGQFSKNTNVGNSDRYTTVYTGPAGEGRDFAPGFDVTNYSGVVAGTFPALNVKFADDLSSPITKEFTLGAGQSFGTRSYAKVLYVQRHTTNVVEDFITIDNGTSPIVVNGVTLGTLDNILYKNSDQPVRKYKALEFLGEHHLLKATLSAQWTVQLQNDGNFEGETPNPTGSSFGDYPEMIVLSRSLPMGRLDDFQRHKVRLWGDYPLTLGHYGQVDISPLYRYNSGLTYSLAATGVALSPIQLARNPGYAGTPTQTLYFGDRGLQSFEGYALFDLGLTYSVPVWRTMRPWIKFETLNLFNNQKLISWDTTIAPDPNGPKDENGLPTSYIEGPRFGTATANSN
jgi:outer membrane receptor protein involved in Fe transport